MSQSQSWIKSPKQLIVVVLLAFVVPIVSIFVLASTISGAGKPPEPNEVVQQRIQPVAQLSLQEEAAVQAVRSGKDIYTQACAACHASGVANAPKYGDKQAWAPRIKQGADALVASGLKGKGVMPPKGGFSGSDAEFKAAVNYLLEAVK